MLEEQDNPKVGVTRDVGTVWPREGQIIFFEAFLGQRKRREASHFLYRKKGAVLIEKMIDEGGKRNDRASRRRGAPARR